MGGDKQMRNTFPASINATQQEREIMRFGRQAGADG